MASKTRKPDSNRRLSARYEGLNPFSMVMNTAIKNHLPPKTELLGKIILEWPKLMDGLPTAEALPSGVQFRQGKNQATLLLSTTAAKSLEIEYAVPQTLDRLNRFIGKDIFTKILIKQDRVISQKTETTSTEVTEKPANANYKSLKLTSKLDETLAKKLQTIYQYIQERTRTVKETAQ